MAESGMAWELLTRPEIDKVVGKCVYRASLHDTGQSYSAGLAKLLVWPEEVVHDSLCRLLAEGAVELTKFPGRPRSWWMWSWVSVGNRPKASRVRGRQWLVVRTKLVDTGRMAGEAYGHKRRYQAPVDDGARGEWL